ncbi:MAG: GntR family transcriptional regulator [Thermodesulfobacteriota bacterium]
MNPKLFIDSGLALTREPISTSIMNLLVDYLLQQELKPGDKLPSEMELAQQLKVGRNSVREAMKMLSSLGVIEIRRGLGTFISQSLPSSAFNSLILSLAFEQGTSQELAELRIFFEAGLIEMIMDKISPADFDDLVAANERLGEEARTNPKDSRRLRDLDIAFHRRLLAVTGNKFIINMGTAVFTIYRTTTEKNVGLVPLKVYENHKLLLETIRQRDKSGFIQLLTRLVWETMNRITASQNGG